ncbi:MAG: D-alanyl-D-alanine carboxypeptidase [Actinobacteria bacterium]|nr:D-alanyl-D-alanine carboxypeptidase [Actinomycetota bacterium]
MSRRRSAPFLALLLPALLALALVSAAPAFAQQEDEAPANPNHVDDPRARAWVLVDADSGAVLAALNHHETFFVASLAKVMTAFVTLEQLQTSYEIEISERASQQELMRIGMQPGERWKLDDALHALLMVSANDAAYAMAEAAGGGVAEFSQLMQRTADRLGMKDSKWLDPAGFDGEQGYGGGTKASSYDLAVISRNALEVPEIAAIVKKPTYQFTGGDGQPHTLRNHNKMLTNFPDSTGVKTGYTKAAGHTLIASAERGGRRLIAVVLGAQDTYAVAAALLNQGFNTAADTKGTGEVLPATSFSRAQPETEDAAPAEATGQAESSGSSLMSSLTRPLWLLFVMLVGAFFARREQIKQRKRRRMAMRRAYLDSKRRGMIDVIDAERYYGTPRRSPHVAVMRPEDDLWPPREMRGPNGSREREPSSQGW